MVWYVPPLSPVMSLVEGEGAEGDPDDVFPLIDELRIPIRYLANMLSAGDEQPVRTALRRLAAMRRHMRDVSFGGEPDDAVASAVGLTPGEVEHLFRLLALAKYDERYVIPKTHREVAGDVADLQGACGIGGARVSFSKRLGLL
jgi:nitrate reductase beta subunit